MNGIKYITALTALLLCQASSASESWYVVNNYTGTVGKYPVHLSLQTYSFGSKISVKGSYYYDRYRAPIALYGRETAEGVTLCEVSSGSDFEKLTLTGGEDNLEGCPFKLVNSEQGLKGVWKNDKSSMEVNLVRTASMDPTHITGHEGRIEIPFWGQTATQSFIGIYENGVDGLAINQVNVLDKKEGRVIQVINPQTENCDFGFYMTAVYQNVESLSKQTISFNCYSTKADISNEYTFDKTSAKYQQDK